MRHYIGIDLGTTNSVIASFDEKGTRIYKSPEQNDVTPSAIHIDRHGHRYYGRRAYEMAAVDDKNTAVLFKRYLGTNMLFHFEHAGLDMTPEMCSAEMLRALFGYLPREWQEDPETVTVITVPAAFNQMKKEATLEAAKMANLGQVALMQEPVAAVMSVMKNQHIDGIFVIYDLGGGTFDVSVMEHFGGRVNLLAQGGREMCGGRDWDRAIYRSIVLPWLEQNFELPEKFDRLPEYRKLRQLGMFAAEQAKIELSRNNEAYIQMSEMQVGLKDGGGKEIYLDIPITRGQMDGLIADMIDITVETSREVIGKAGCSMDEIQKMIFIGGPTMYEPLQTKVMQALGIEHKGEANPMTAVAEGAAIYAESLTWESGDHKRRDTQGQIGAGDVDIRYEERVSADMARIAVVCRNGGSVLAEVSSLDNGWSSGRVTVAGRGIIQVPLMEERENRFGIKLFQMSGEEIPLEKDQVVISRVLATVSSIVASHSIAAKVLDKVDGHPIPVYLVEANEHLPKHGTISLRAGKRLVAGSNDALVFTLWEGEIADPIEDNRYIGTYRIPGTSFERGIIPVGAEILCDYEINDAGTLHLGVSIPCVGTTIGDRNFYSRMDGQVDVMDPSEQLADVNRLLNRTAQMKQQISDRDLEAVRRQLFEIQGDLQSEDPETVQMAANSVLACQRKMAEIRQRYMKVVQRMELDGLKRVLEQYRSSANPDRLWELDNLYETGLRAIERNSAEVDTIQLNYSRKIAQVLFEQDEFVRDQFMIRIRRREDYDDQQAFNELRAEGLKCIEEENYDQLRSVIRRMAAIDMSDQRDSSEKMLDQVSVTRG